jgi:hypothetical protein
VKSIVGVPETITHAQVVAAAELLGFDPKVVRSIRIGLNYVEVMLHAATPPKLVVEYPTLPFVEGFTDRVATHILYYDLDAAEPTVDD